MGHHISEPRQHCPLAEGLSDSESSEVDEEICA